jgi:hypothetical protein
VLGTHTECKALLGYSAGDDCIVVRGDDGALGGEAMAAPEVPYSAEEVSRIGGDDGGGDGLGIIMCTVPLVPTAALLVLVALAELLDPPSRVNGDSAGDEAVRPMPLEKWIAANGDDRIVVAGAADGLIIDANADDADEPTDGRAVVRAAIAGDVDDERLVVVAVADVADESSGIEPADEASTRVGVCANTIGRIADEVEADNGMLDMVLFRCMNGCWNVLPNVELALEPCELLAMMGIVVAVDMILLDGVVGALLLPPELLLLLLLLLIVRVGTRLVGIATVAGVGVGVGVGVDVEGVDAAAAVGNGVGVVGVLGMTVVGVVARIGNSSCANSSVAEIDETLADCTGAASVLLLLLAVALLGAFGTWSSVVAVAIAAAAAELLVVSASATAIASLALPIVVSTGVVLDAGDGGVALVGGFAVVVVVGEALTVGRSEVELVDCASTTTSICSAASASASASASAAWS